MGNIEKINFSDVKAEKNTLYIFFDKGVLKEENKYKIVLQKHKKSGCFIPEKCEVDYKEGKITVDFTDFYGEVDRKSRLTWIVYLEEEKEGNTQKYELVKDGVAKSLTKEEKRYFNRFKRVTDVLGYVGFEEENCKVVAMYNEDGVLFIMSVLERKYLAQLMVFKLLKAKIKKNNFCLSLKYPVGDYTFKKLVLIFRAKKIEDKTEYEFVIDSSKEKNGYIYIKAHLPLENIEYRQTFWDVSLVLDYEGIEQRFALKNKSKLFRMKFCSLFANDKYVLPDGMIVFPCLTRNKAICLQYREKSEFDGISFRLKERIAYLEYLLTKPFLNRKNIMLVYEKFCYMAQDNGYYFFKYCMDNNMEKVMGRKIYYIMDKKSPDMEVLKEYKSNVIDFMSIKHIRYLLAAKLLVSTDTRAHGYAWRKRGSFLEDMFRNKKLVFLQHGVTAFKRVDFLYGKARSGSCDLFVVTSDDEKEIVYKEFGYEYDEIAVTGFARWDVLNDKSNGSREIILMPTWRNWLENMSDEMFMQSRYYINYMELLKSEKLNEVLEKNDLKLNFYLHPKFKEYLSNFAMDAERIRFIPFGEEPLNELMMKCRMLITDYSSVAWDTFYQDKPVLFFQFDLDEYNETHRSYIDMENDLFGDRVETIECLTELIDEYANNDFKVKPEYETMRKGCFKYIDNDNSKRICEHIMQKGL